MEAAIEVQEEEGYEIVPEIMIPLVGEKKELKFVKDIVVEVAEQMVAQSCSPLAHKGLLTAAKVLALSCIRTMDRPDVIEAAKKEVTKRNGGHYTCPLPDSVQPPLDTY